MFQTKMHFLKIQITLTSSFKYIFVKAKLLEMFVNKVSFSFSLLERGNLGKAVLNVARCCESEFSEDHFLNRAKTINQWKKINLGSNRFLPSGLKPVLKLVFNNITPYQLTLFLSVLTDCVLKFCGLTALQIPRLLYKEFFLEVKVSSDLLTAWLWGS